MVFIVAPCEQSLTQLDKPLELFFRLYNYCLLRVGRRRYIDARVPATGAGQ
jgi:hypothetical protein